MADKDRSRELIRLVYCSTATFSSQEGTAGVEKEVARILMESRRNNPALELGGVLHYGNGYFFQALEGERRKVNDRYERIVNDERHRDVELLSVHRVKERLFPDWSMKYVAVEDRIRQLLGKKGVANFNPYNFDEDFCEELIRCFVESPEAAADAKPAGGDRKDPEGRKPSLMQRIFG